MAKDAGYVATLTNTAILKRLKDRMRLYITIKVLYIDPIDFDV